MYSKGTSALKTEYYTYDENKIHDSKEFKIKKDAQRRRKNQKARQLIKKRIVAAVALVFAMSFVVLFRYAAIAKEFSELTKARSELEKINASVMETQIKADGSTDPKKIEQEAQRLGMQQPAKDQIKYISLGNTDNGEVLKTEKTNTLSAFINHMMVILEYLY